MSRLAVFFLVLILAAPAFAGPLTTIDSYSPGYLSGTSYIDLSSLTSYQDYSSISDGIFTVGFGSATNKRVTPGGGWATWSESPESMRTSGGTLPVLYSNGAQSLTMTFSQPVDIFGFEAEPNQFSTYPMTAIFYGTGHTELGRITRDVNGSSGARLFAGSSVHITAVEFSAGDSFAVGGFRYSLSDAPEPGTYALLGLGLLGLAVLKRRFRKLV